MNWHSTLFEKIQDIKKQNNWRTLQALCQERGAVFVMTAILLPVLCGFMGIAYDVGNLYMHKTKLQNVTDAAALAGGAVFKERSDQGTDEKNETTIVLKNNHTQADAVATDYINKNKIDLGSNIQIEELSALKYTGTTVAPTEQVNDTTSRVVTTEHNKIYYRVILSDEVDLFFLPVILPNTRKQTVMTASVAQLDNTTTTTETTVTTSGGGGGSTNKTIFDDLFTFSESLYVPNKYANYDFDGSSEVKNAVKTTFDGDIIYTNANAEEKSPEPVDSIFKKLYGGSESKGKQMRAAELIDYAHYAEQIGIDFASEVYRNIFNKKFNPPNNPIQLQNDQITASDIKNSGASIFVWKINANGNMVLNQAVGTGNSPIFIKIPHTAYSGGGEIPDIVKITTTTDNVRPIIIVYFGTKTIQFDSSNNGTFRGLIYAPYGVVQSNNHKDFKFYGNIIARKIEIQGEFQEYHLENYLADDTDFAELPKIVRSHPSITQETFDKTFQVSMDYLTSRESNKRKKQIFEWMKAHANDQESYNNALDSGKSVYVGQEELQTIAKADIIQAWTLIYQETLNRLQRIEGFKLSDLNNIDKFKWDNGYAPAPATGGGSSTTTTTTTTTVPGVFRLINPRTETNPYFGQDSNI